MSGRTHEVFDDLLAGEPIEEPSRSPRSRGRLVASIAAVAAGGLLLAGTALFASIPSDQADPVAGPSPTLTPFPDPTPTAATVVGQVDDRGISALADARAADELAARTGIPSRAMRAYLGATLKVAAENPACGLGWNTLAGIGSVESDHGTFGGARIAADGSTAPPIIGIALDGNDSAVIRDSDGGALDGDATWDRAVGPMQFIPETWARWGADGNGDGVADPQHIDDSALAAGRYLCAAGGDLTDLQGWIAAVAAYNDAVQYNNRVAEAATVYASLAE